MLTRVPDYYEAFHCLAGGLPPHLLRKVGGGDGPGDRPPLQESPGP